MDNHNKCLYCDQSSNHVPLITFVYQGNSYMICPQHLPVLIHNPSNLAGKLPGAESLQSAKGHDH
jgi:hypothetical protein